MYGKRKKYSRALKRFGNSFTVELDEVGRIPDELTVEELLAPRVARNLCDKRKHPTSVFVPFSQ
eukprot:498416-Amphidinium_carterae.1